MNKQKPGNSNLDLNTLLEDRSLPEEVKPILKDFLAVVKDYDCFGERPAGRWQDRQMSRLISQGASVLDLGCGDGKLLQNLISERSVFGQGVELDREKVYQCIENGVSVFQADIDKGLSIFNDQSFDYVILEETLQTLKDPVATLTEMLRIGRQGIVTFPNFGYWKVRMDLLVRGRMPVTDWLPYRWYDTPNIHLFTYDDFVHLIQQFHCTIKEGYAMVNGQVVGLDEGTNFEAEELLLVIKKEL